MTRQGQPGFDRGRALAWLTSGEVLAPDGEVVSWSNPDHPGFAYPEAAAIWLGWAAWRKQREEPGPDAGQVHSVTHCLEQALASGQGLGQHGRTYLFDTCVAIQALSRAADHGLTDAVSHPARRGAARAIERFVVEDTPVLPTSVQVAVRWSETWGPHQTRAAGLLAEAGARLDDEILSELADRVWQRTLAVAGEGARRYVHGWLYALEGALIRGESDETITAQARALAALQHEDGGLPAWTGGPGPRRSDSTAQAVRVWSALDAAAFATPIRRGLRFLTALQDQSGGLSYESGSADLTTWSTIFADQAAAWAENGAEPGSWI